MRKYKGAEPNTIKEIRIAGGRYIVQTNNGGEYFIDDQHPIEGRSVMDYRFSRAQPMRFKQEGACFHRMIDGWALPFASYLIVPFVRAGMTREGAHHIARTAFVEDMARQGIAAKFTA